MIGGPAPDGVSSRMMCDSPTGSRETEEASAPSGPESGVPGGLALARGRPGRRAEHPTTAPWPGAGCDRVGRNGKIRSAGVRIEAGSKRKFRRGTDPASGYLRIVASTSYELYWYALEEGWKIPSAYDREVNLFRYLDGRFAFSERYANFTLMRERGDRFGPMPYEVARAPVRSATHNNTRGSGARHTNLILRRPSGPARVVLTPPFCRVGGFAGILAGLSPTLRKTPRSGERVPPPDPRAPRSRSGLDPRGRSALASGRVPPARPRETRRFGAKGGRPSRGRALISRFPRPLRWRTPRLRGAPRSSPAPHGGRRVRPSRRSAAPCATTASGWPGPSWSPRPR